MSHQSEVLQRQAERPDPVRAAGQGLQMDLPVSNASTLHQGDAAISVAWNEQGQAKVKRA